MPKVYSQNSIIAFFLIIFGHFLNHFLAYVLVVSLYVVEVDIPLDKAEAGLISTVQLIVIAIFTFILGIIGDKWLQSKILFIPVGIMLMGIHLIIGALATNYTLLVLAASLGGLGASFYHPVAFAMIADLFERKKGITMALNGTFGMIGTSIAPGIMGTLSKTIGWRTAFEIFGLVAIVLAVLKYFGFKYIIRYEHSEEEKRERNIRIQTMSKRERFRVWLKSEFLVVLKFYILVCVIYGIFRSGIYRITNQFLPFIFKDFYNYNIEESGWFSTIILVTGGFTSLLGGLMSDKISTSLTMTVSSLGITVLLLLIFIFAGSVKSLTIIILMFFLYSAFLFFSATAQTKYISENVPQKSRSTAIGVLFAISSALTGLFPWTYGLIIDSYGYIYSFFFISMLSLVALILSSTLLGRDIKNLVKKGKIERSRT